MFEVNFSGLLPKVSKKKPGSSPGASGMATMFASMSERLNMVGFKVKTLDVKLSLLGESSMIARAILDRIESRLRQK